MDKKKIVAKVLEKLHTSDAKNDLLDKFEKELAEVGNSLRTLNEKDTGIKDNSKKQKLKREFTDVEKEFLKYLNSY